MISRQKPWQTPRAGRQTPASWGYRAAVCDHPTGTEACPGIRSLTPGIRSFTLESGSLTAALVGLGVVVAAFLADPVTDQVLGALKFLRPCIAGDQARGLPHHVELAIAFDFANEHRLGDVMVREHLGNAAGQVRRFDSR